MKISLETPIAIVGLGLSGESAFSFLLALGYARKDLITFDEKASNAQVTDPDELIRKYKPKTLVVSPGVHLKKKWILEALQQGITVTSEINLACGILENEKMIGVTGSVGKSTTTSLLGEVVRTIDPFAFVGGNLGVPFCDYAKAVVLQQRPRAQWVILELSSFQLENCALLELNGVALTSLTANHLERYSSADEYYEVKLSLLRKSKGPVVLNEDSQDLLAKKKDIEKMNLQPNLVHWISPRSTEISSLGLEKAQLIGKHNQQNLAIAAKLLIELGFAKKNLAALLSYQGLPHRLEIFGSWNQITFVNDSKATSIESVLMAVESCQSKIRSPGKIHLLLGGRDKNLPWEQLSPLKQATDLSFYFFGESKDLIPQRSTLRGDSFSDLELCFQALAPRLHAGDWVLLSPGGTSLDQFKNFEDRGNFFKNLVQNYYSVR